MLDFLNGQKKRKGKCSYYAHARGPCSGKAGGQPPSVAKTAQKTGQPAARGTAAKMRKNSQVLRSDRTAKTPEDLAAFTVSGTAQTPAHNDILCGRFAFLAGDPLASPPSFQRATAAPARPCWASYGRGATFLIGFFGLFRHKPSCSSPLSLVPRMVYEGAMIERTFYSYCSSKDLRGRSERKGFTLILYLERFCIGRWCVVCGCRLEAMQNLL